MFHKKLREFAQLVFFDKQPMCPVPLNQHNLNTRGKKMVWHNHNAIKMPGLLTKQFANTNQIGGQEGILQTQTMN